MGWRHWRWEVLILGHALSGTLIEKLMGMEFWIRVGLYLVDKWQNNLDDTIVMDYVCGWLITHQVVQCCMTIWLLLYIFIYDECYMHDEAFFLFLTNHPNTCIILLLIKLYSLCSSPIFLDEDIVETYTKHVPKDEQQGRWPLLTFSFCFFFNKLLTCSYFLIYVHKFISGP